MTGGAAEPPAGPNERDRLQQSRARALARLQLACTPIERAALEQSLDELDARLAALPPGNRRASLRPGA
jgi:hypothetical protein